MQCKSCYNDAPYQCSVCGQYVCFDHARTVGDRVACTDCAPSVYLSGERQEKPAKSGSGVKVAFIRALLMTIGLGVIYVIFDFVVTTQLSAMALPPDIETLVGSLRSMGLMVVAASGAITALLFVLYLLGRAKR